MQNLFYVIGKGAWAAAKGSVIAVAWRFIKYRDRQNFSQPTTRSTSDLLLSLCPTCIFPKTELAPFPTCQGTAEMNPQAWVCISVSLFFFSPCRLPAPRGCPPTEGSASPSAGTREPVGAQMRAQPERRHQGFCKTSHVGFSPFAVGVWTCNSEIASSHQFFWQLERNF